MQAIRKETLRVQEEWEASLTAVAKSNKASSADDRFVTSECYRLKQRRLLINARCAMVVYLYDMDHMCCNNRILTL